MSDLIPTPVTDKNGKLTTVHKKADGTYSANGGVRVTRELPKFPTYDGVVPASFEAVNTVSDSRRSNLTPPIEELGDNASQVVATVMALPAMKFDTATPLYLRRHMTDDVYYFSTPNGSETSIAIPRLNDELRLIWLNGRISSEKPDDDDEMKADTARYRGILQSVLNPKPMQRNDVATEFAAQNAGVDFSGPAMSAIYQWGKKIDELYPNENNAVKAHALKERVLADCSDAGLRKSADPSRFWESYVFYNSYAS